MQGELGDLLVSLLPLCCRFTASSVQELPGKFQNNSLELLFKYFVIDRWSPQLLPNAEKSSGQEGARVLHDCAIAMHNCSTNHQTPKFLPN